MNFDPFSYKYNSKRNLVYSHKGMVSTSHPYAAQAGLDILKKGGNAIDAAIAAASTLTVVEPTSNGIGADCFAIVWYKNKIYGLNASGYSPNNISIDKLKEKGFEDIPKFGWEPVTVPGAPAGWASLWKKFGLIDFNKIFKPAIEIAEKGHPVSPTTSYYWQRASKIYKKMSEKNPELFKNWIKTFTKKGKAPVPGELWKSQDHANTLKKIASTVSKDFYEGSIAEKIINFSKKTGGYLQFNDLKNYSPSFVNPISVNYNGYDIWEIPPNGQGITALIALNILNNFDMKKMNKLDKLHYQIEAMKLAFADTKYYVTDPDYMDVNPSDLLSKKYGEKRSKLINDKANKYETGNPHKGGTVYLAAADKYGNMVSFIQSNYMGFGSGIVVPETGIALQNRGKNFKFDESHPNCLMPKKRPYHTIIPGFITKNESAVGPFGVMGGFMQPQGHLQVISNLIDENLNPQESLDAPRWMFNKNKEVYFENEYNINTIQKLSRKGHRIKIPTSSGMFGRGQIILKNSQNVYCGGTEKRTDGYIAIY